SGMLNHSNSAPNRVDHLSPHSNHSATFRAMTAPTKVTALKKGQEEAEKSSWKSTCIGIILFVIYSALIFTALEVFAPKYSELRDALEVEILVPSLLFLFISDTKNKGTKMKWIFAFTLLALAIGSYILSLFPFDSLDKHYLSIMQSASLLILFPIYFANTNQQATKENEESASHDTKKSSILFFHLFALYAVLMLIIVTPAFALGYFAILDIDTIAFYFLAASAIVGFSIWQLFPLWEVKSTTDLLRLLFLVLPCTLLALALLNAHDKHPMGFEYVQLRAIIEVDLLLPLLLFVSMADVKNKRAMMKMIIAVGFIAMAVGSYVITRLTIDLKSLMLYASILDSATLIVAYPMFFSFADTRNDRYGFPRKPTNQFSFWQLLVFHSILFSIVVAPALSSLHYGIADLATIDAHLLVATWIVCLAFWKIFPNFEVNHIRGLLGLVAIILCVLLTLAMCVSYEGIKAIGSLLGLFQLYLQFKLLFKINVYDMWTKKEPPINT
ncbi:hypothetical protein PFISCL1PPCAC_21008, partial [Pristionchus fissidentatus]